MATPYLAKHFKKSFLEFISEYPKHPIVVSTLEQIIPSKKIPDLSLINSIDDWEKLYVEIIKPSPIEQPAPVQAASPATPARSPYELRLTHKATEVGTANITRQYSSYRKITFTPEVLQQAVAEGDIEILSDYTHAQNTAAAEYDNYTELPDIMDVQITEQQNVNVEYSRETLRAIYAQALQEFTPAEEIPTVPTT